MKTTTWLLLSLFGALSCSTHSGSEKIVFEETLVALNDRSGTLKTWTLHCGKVAIFQNTASTFRHPFDWREYIERYPELKFIFVFVSKDEQEIKAWLATRELNDYPVFWDVDNRFFQQNNFESGIKFISFILDQSNNIITLSNPTIPDFEKRLTTLQENCRLAITAPTPLPVSSPTPPRAGFSR